MSEETTRVSKVEEYVTHSIKTHVESTTKKNETHLVLCLCSLPFLFLLYVFVSVKTMGNVNIVHKRSQPTANNVWAKCLNER